MSSQFKVKELGDCLELVIDHRGKTPKKLGADWTEAGIPTISAKNVNGGRLVSRDSIRYVSFEVYKRWMKQDVQRGDCLLVSEGATLGECMLWDYDFPIVLGQRIFCLRANPAILAPRFLYAYMTSRGFQDEIIGRATGTSVDGLRQTEVLKLELRLPPIAQQELIGDFLYNLDNKIELNQQMNSTLETMARALFQSWFVDFDPVRSKLDGRPPVGLDPETAALFPEHFEDSALGPIPNGWEVGRLDDVLTLQRGFDLLTPDRTHGKYPVMAASGPNGCHDKFMVRGPGVTTGRSGVLGRVFFIHDDFWPLNTSLWVKEFKRVSSVYAFHLLRDLDFEMFNAGSAVPTLNRNHVHNLPVVIPPKSIIEAFDSQVMPLMKLKKANEDQSNTLATLRNTLLPKLLSGELSITPSN